MYFWSDGYEEYGILRKDHKRIREEELAAKVDDIEDKFLFEPVNKVSVRQNKKRKLKRFLKSKVQRALDYAEWKMRKYSE